MVSVVIGLTLAALVIGGAVGYGFWQARDGCEALAEREDRTIVANRWWAKGDYCVTRDADGVTHTSNESAWWVFLVVLGSIPVAMAVGGQAIALTDRPVRSRPDQAV